MRNAFTKGVITGVSIYGLGALLTTFAYLIAGWGLPYGPTVIFVLVYLTIGAGLIRLLITTGGALVNDSARAKGELAIHLAVFLFLLLFFIWTIYMEGESESTGPGFVSGVAQKHFPVCHLITFFFSLLKSL
jgi:hypothetical protein